MTIKYLDAKRIQGSGTDKDSLLRATTGDGTTTGATRVSAGHSSGQGANLGTYAYDFDGSNDYVSLGDNFDFERTDSFSYSFWVRSPADAFGIWYASVEGSGGSSSGYQGIQIRNNRTTRDVELALTSHWMDNILRCGFNEDDLYDNAWHMVTITYDGTSLISGCNFYFDGSLATKSSGEETLSATIVPSTVHPAIIGARNTPSGITDFTDLPFMDQFLIYSKELTSSEVTALWNSGNGVATPSSTNLVGWYNFEQEVGSPLENQVYKLKIPENTLFEQTDTYKYYWLQNGLWGNLNYGYAQGGGNSPHNIIDRFPFATDTNASSVGTLVAGNYEQSSASDPAGGYSYLAGGKTGSTRYAYVQRHQNAASANSVQVGSADGSATRLSSGWHSLTHGYRAGGWSGSTNNAIKKYSFGTSANESDIADLTVARHRSGQCSSATHGYMTGGHNN